MAHSQTSSADIAVGYDRDGFVTPFDIISAEDTQALRADFEAAEAELAGDPERLRLLHTYPERLLPSFNRLIRHENLVEAAAAVLGPDLMVWSAGLFVKEARSPKIISWHQDLTYWGLDDAEETTCWFAVSPATTASGCMKFVPGSHTQDIVAHIDTYAENNLLSRGQEIAVDVREEDGVAIELQPGQASMHHGHLFHASGPNTTDDRRIGMAIRYIKPSMKQQSGDRPLVSLVRGADHFGHFTIVAPPKGRLLAEEFELCRQDAELKRRLLL